MTEIRYTITVYLTQAVDPAYDEPEDYASPASRRIIEKAVLQALRKLDGDADCEVIETTILRDTDEPPDADYERAAAKARSDDFEETNGKDWT